MNISVYSDLIKENLYPKPYTNCISEPPQGIDLIIWHKKFLFARYALAVTSWESSLGESFLERKRSIIRRELGAIWCFKEVGLYLVICGPKSQWKVHAKKMLADKTGLHAVIIQAVHFIDLKTGESCLNQSAWGPVRFGGVDSVASVIASIPRK